MNTIIPDKWNIMEILFRVEEDSNERLESRRGQVQFDKAVIKLNPDYIPSVQLKTFIHENIEALNNELGIKLKHHQIDLLEAGIYQIIMANKLWTLQQESDSTGKSSSKKKTG